MDQLFLGLQAHTPAKVSMVKVEEDSVVAETTKTADTGDPKTGPSQNKQLQVANLGFW
jgi:hypothetical protein